MLKESAQQTVFGVKALQVSDPSFTLPLSRAIAADQSLAQ